MSRRTWAIKFAEAARGVWLAVRHERSFRVHLPMAVLVLVLAAVLRCDWLEWCLLIGCVGAVFAAETFNSSLEAFFHAQDDTVKSRVSGVLDRAAGAVLLVSGTAAVIGLIVFGRRVVEMLGERPA
jgi:diacylglycerol kinase